MRAAPSLGVWALPGLQLLLHPIWQLSWVCVMWAMYCQHCTAYVVLTYQVRSRAVR